MGDELGELPRRLRMMSDTLSALNSFKSGKIQKDKPIKYIPRSTSLYFLKTATEASFSSFNKDQRYAIKSLFAQSSGLDDYIANMKETNVSKETAQECIDNCKRYLYTGCCMLNTMRIVVSSPLATSIADDEATINSVLSELNIDLNFEDLIITSTSNL
jgi:hypothetical protein